MRTGRPCLCSCNRVRRFIGSPTVSPRRAPNRVVTCLTPPQSQQEAPFYCIKHGLMWIDPSFNLCVLTVWMCTFPFGMLVHVLACPLNSLCACTATGTGEQASTVLQPAHSLERVRSPSVAELVGRLSSMSCWYVYPHAYVARFHVVLDRRKTWCAGVPGDGPSTQDQESWHRSIGRNMRGHMRSNMSALLNQGLCKCAS